MTEPVMPLVSLDRRAGAAPGQVSHLAQSLFIDSPHAPHHRFVAVIITDMPCAFHSLDNRCGKVLQTFRNLVRQCGGQLVAHHSTLAYAAYDRRKTLVVQPAHNAQQKIFGAATRESDKEMKFPSLAIQRGFA